MLESQIPIFMGNFCEKLTHYSGTCPYTLICEPPTGLPYIYLTANLYEQIIGWKEIFHQFILQFFYSANHNNLQFNIRACCHTES